jgi:flagella basal body P-ring formation protein FlgA
MMRTTVLLILLALSAPAAAQISGAITPKVPTFKREVVVADELVRIGDLIEGAGMVADIAVFRAPDVGTTGRIPVARVAEAVRRHNLFGMNTIGVPDIVVTRASRVISHKDIEARIVRAFSGQYGLGDPEKLTVMFSHDVRTIYAEPGVTADLQVVRSSYDPRSRRFDIALELPGSTLVRRASLRFSGSLVETTEIAVSTRALARGEILTAADVKVERRPKADLPNDAVASADLAVGRATRGPLPAGQPLRSTELVRAELVQRNEMVTLVFEAPGILLTLRGKALESGGEGDLISVQNLQSKRTVQGTVTRQGIVTVAGTRPQIVAPVTTAAASDLSNGARQRTQ